MALSAYGFVQGEEITTLQWAHLAEGVGSAYDYSTGTAFSPSRGPGTRELRLAAGRTTGWGVHVVNDAVLSYSGFPEPTARRAHYAVLVRNWATATVSVTHLDCGGPNIVVPAGLLSLRDGGNVDHQPLAAVIVEPGQPMLVYDLRDLTEKVHVGASPAAFVRPQPGGLYYAPGMTPSVGVVNGAGGTTLAPLNGDTGWVDVTPSTAFRHGDGGGAFRSRLQSRVRDGQVRIEGALEARSSYAGGVVTQGGVLGTLAVDHRPPATVVRSAHMVSPYDGELRYVITPDGVITGRWASRSVPVGGYVYVEATFSKD